MPYGRARKAKVRSTRASAIAEFGRLGLVADARSAAPRPLTPGGTRGNEVESAPGREAGCQSPFGKREPLALMTPARVSLSRTYCNHGCCGAGSSSKVASSAGVAASAPREGWAASPYLCSTMRWAATPYFPSANRCSDRASSRSATCRGTTGTSSPPTWSIPRPRARRF